MANDTVLDPRIRAWLLAEPVPVRAGELSADPVTLYRWLNGQTRPRGAMLALVLQRVEAWEAAERTKAAAVKAEQRGRREVPEARPWAQ